LPWGHTSLLEIVQEQFRILPIRVCLLPDQFARSLMGRQSAVDARDGRAAAHVHPQRLRRHLEPTCLFLSGEAAGVLCDSLSPEARRERPWALGKSFEGGSW
jgi:hypothetical protein